MQTDQEQARLVMLQGPHPERHFGLSEGEITVGREMQNQIVIGDPEVSRRHALLRQTEEGTSIEDLGSTNGTFVNGVRVTHAVPLVDGDRIHLGETIELVYQRALPARDRTILAGAGRVTPPSGEFERPAELAAGIESPVEPPIEAGPPRPIEPVELYDAEALELPPPFDEPPVAGTEKETPAEEEPAPPKPPVEVRYEERPAPPSFEPLRPARYEERREMPPVPPRLPAREPGPSYRQTQRQEPPPPPYQEPPPPPYDEEYEPEPPRPRSNRKRTLLIGCGCLLLLLGCAAIVGLAYLIWNAPYEFFEDPIRNFGLLFEILTMPLVLP